MSLGSCLHNSFVFLLFARCALHSVHAVVFKPNSISETGLDVLRFLDSGFFVQAVEQIKLTIKLTRFAVKRLLRSF